MNDQEDDEPPIDLTSLRREVVAPPGLEDEVVQRLRGVGLVAAPGAPARRGRPWLAPIAAMVAGIAVGWTVRPLARAPDRAGPLFAFVFAGGPQSGDALTHAIVANRAWARRAAAGRVVGAQKLLPEGRILEQGGQERPAPPPRSDDLIPTGFFLVQARDLEEATTLARSNPHLALGGSVTIRPVDDLAWLPLPPVQ